MQYAAKATNNHATNSQTNGHMPVLLKEIIQLLDPKAGEFIIDGTLDGGGHAEAIIERLIPNGIFLGVDYDPNMLELGKARLDKYEHCGITMAFESENFAMLPEILERLQLGRADGLLLDLGFSSEQLEWSGRGFSFLRDEPLLMTYRDEEKPVRTLLVELSETELSEIIGELGGERYARRIAYAVKMAVAEKPIETSRELAEIVRRAVPKGYERGRINPATRTFLALRMYANHERQNLRKVLGALPYILHKGSRAAVISFQSSEDRIVKNVFRDLAARGAVELIIEKPLTATPEEIAKNPRARSAKLRALIML